MSPENRRAALVGVGVAAVVLGALFWSVGVGGVIETLSGARLDLLAVVAATALGWLVAWGAVLRIVLGALGSTLSVSKSVLAYSAAVFANNVTPFGQAGGEPVAALVISDVTDTEYETGLASIASVDALNFVPSILLSTVGLAYYATRVDFQGWLRSVAVAVVALAALAPILAFVGWRWRYRVERALVRTLAPALTWVGRRVPLLPTPTAESIRSRVEGFFRDIERIGTARKHLVAALSFSALGWVLQAVGMWVTFLALDTTIAFYVPLFVIPISTIASVFPTPGGLGGIETAHVGLLTLLTPASAVTVTAAVTIHRIGGFLLMTSLGGGSMAVLRVMDH